jgi:peptide/nickel transport system permease protein
VLGLADPIAQDLAARLRPPSPEHWLGTDAYGRDVLSRLIYAARVDLPLAILGALIPAVVGTILGTVAGYFGKVADFTLMRVAELAQAFPAYVFFIVAAFVVGPGVQTFLVTASLIAWVNYARIVRAQTFVVRESDYMKAAKTSGVGWSSLLFRHLLPNTVPQAITYFASDVVFALVALSSLSYLGLGIAEPTPEWGGMIAQGQAYIRSAWWLSTAPGVVTVIVGLAFVLISEGIDDMRRIER